MFLLFLLFVMAFYVINGLEEPSKKPKYYLVGNHILYEFTSKRKVNKFLKQKEFKKKGLYFENKYRMKLYLTKNY